MHSAQTHTQNAHIYIRMRKHNFHAYASKFSALPYMDYSARELISYCTNQSHINFHHRDVYEAYGKVFYSSALSKFAYMDHIKLSSSNQ